MNDSRAFHEDFDHGDKVGAGSERAFGIVFAAVFAAIALWPLIDGGPVRLWAIAVGVLFLAAAVLKPVLLGPLNRVWFRVGMILHKVVNPLVMGLLFYLTITPMALVLRVLGKDPLRRRFEPGAETYWIERIPAGPAPDTMRNQF